MTNAPNPTKASATARFQGFEQLDATFVFCPNQFLDLCITTQNRPVVRLVGYVLYETLKWLDKDGRPQNQDIATPFSKLVSDAGIARGAIRPSIDAAAKMQFLHCVQTPRCGGVNQSPSVGAYRLTWSESRTYAKQITEFDGFFCGEGNRTPIPHDFFTTVIRRESLAVIRVIAAVIRHTIGHANQFGGRKQSSPLSHRFIQRWSGIKSSSTLNSALQLAMNNGYIVRTQKGSCHGIQTAAHYSLNWHAKDKTSASSPKIEAGDRQSTLERGVVQKSKPQQFMNRSKEAVQEPQRVKEQTQRIHKQHTSVVAENSVVDELIGIGFDDAAANILAKHNKAEVIRRQIRWLPHREVSRNKLGLLRNAIEHDWSKPAESSDAVARQKLEQSRQASDRHAQQRAADVIAANRRKHERRQRKERLCSEWDRMPLEEREVYRRLAIEHCQSTLLQDLLRKRGANEAPATEFLDEMAVSLGLPTVVVVESTQPNIAGTH